MTRRWQCLRLLTHPNLLWFVYWSIIHFYIVKRVWELDFANDILMLWSDEDKLSIHLPFTGMHSIRSSKNNALNCYRRKVISRTLRVNHKCESVLFVISQVYENQCTITIIMIVIPMPVFDYEQLRACVLSLSLKSNYYFRISSAIYFNSFTFCGDAIQLPKMVLGDYVPCYGKAR